MRNQPNRYQYPSSYQSSPSKKQSFQLTKSTLMLQKQQTTSNHKKMPSQEIQEPKKIISLKSSPVKAKQVKLPNITSSGSKANLDINNQFKSHSNPVSNNNTGSSKSQQQQFFNAQPEVSQFQNNNSNIIPFKQNQSQIDEEYSPIPKSKFQKQNNLKVDGLNTLIKLQPVPSNEGQSSPRESPPKASGKISVEEVFSKSKPGLGPNRMLKTNQDSFIIHQYSATRQYFGVCDGHGLHGHLVSQNIKKKLVENLGTQLKQTDDIKKALTNSYIQCNRELKTSGIDATFSGTTCVTVLFDQAKLYCANAGDSRAVLYSCKNNVWVHHALSIDHKPDLEKEKQRIINNGGRVNCFQDEDGNSLGPYRVWMKDQDVPGLAMSRSIGDYVAQSVGVIPDPEIIVRDLTEHDKFMVIASDGLWEFIENDQVLNLIMPLVKKKDWNGSVEKLVKEAHSCWLREDEVVDDITVIIVVFSQ